MMGEGTVVPAKDLLLQTLEEAYRGPAWHGPSVRVALRGVTSDVATKRPADGRNSIWELVLHLAYARHRSIVRIAALTGGEAPRFPRRLRSSWFPELPPARDDTTWRADLALLADYQARLLDAVSRAPASVFRERRAGRKEPFGRELMGMALHDAYHAGQIRLLARTLESEVASA